MDDLRHGDGNASNYRVVFGIQIIFFQKVSRMLGLCFFSARGFSQLAEFDRKPVPAFIRLTLTPKMNYLWSRKRSTSDLFVVFNAKWFDFPIAFESRDLISTSHFPLKLYVTWPTDEDAKTRLIDWTNCRQVTTMSSSSSSSLTAICQGKRRCYLARRWQRMPLWRCSSRRAVRDKCRNFWRESIGTRWRPTQQQMKRQSTEPIGKKNRRSDLWPMTDDPWSMT